MTQDNGERAALRWHAIMSRNEMQKCKCLCACSSLPFVGGGGGVCGGDDTCHAADGRQNGDMWEREQAVNRTGANMPHTLTRVNPITASANASLNALQSYTVN